MKDRNVLAAADHPWIIILSSKMILVHANVDENVFVSHVATTSVMLTARPGQGCARPKLCVPWPRLDVTGMDAHRKCSVHVFLPSFSFDSF